MHVFMFYIENTSTKVTAYLDQLNPQLHAFKSNSSQVGKINVKESVLVGIICMTVCGYNIEPFLKAIAQTIQNIATAFVSAQELKSWSIF